MLSLRKSGNPDCVDSKESGMGGQVSEQFPQKNECFNTTRSIILFFLDAVPILSL